MAFVKQVFSLARSNISVAVAVVAPVVIVTRGPLNFLSEVARAASKPGSPLQALGLGDPVIRFAITGIASIVGALLVGWMTKVFLDALEQALPPRSDVPVRTYSIAWGTVTALVYPLSVLIGLLFLLIPGIVLLVRGVVCIPVAISEHVGPMRAFSRSWELTRGRHWQIQAILWILLLAVVCVGAVLVGLTLWIPGANTIIGRSALLTVGNVVGWATIMATVSSGYVQLRAGEELGNVSGAEGAPRPPQTIQERSVDRRSWRRYTVHAVLGVCVLAGIWFATRMTKNPQLTAASETANDAAEPLLNNDDVRRKNTSDAPSLGAASRLVPNDPWQPLGLEAPRTGELRGSVVDPDGAEVQGAHLVAIPADGSVAGARIALRPSGYAGRHGAFRIDGLPAGPYVVELTKLTDRQYEGFAARPSALVEVAAMGSAEVTVKLERQVTIELPLDGPKQRWEPTSYFIDDGANPRVDGFASSSVLADVDEGVLSVTTLPGTVLLSADPCFDQRAEVYTFEVATDGQLSGPTRLPYSQLVTTSIQLEPSDGRSIGEPTGWLVPVCTPAESYVTRKTRALDGSAKPGGSDEVQVARTRRGATWRAIVMAKGYRVAESEPFVSTSEQPSIRVALSAADAASITIEVRGLPKSVHEEIEPKHFTVMYRSPSGLYAEAPKGWMIEELGKKRMSFDVLPEGERIHVHFAIRRSGRLFAAYADVRIEDGASHVLVARKVRHPPEPFLWDGKWYRMGRIERIDPPIWVTKR
jgi:hypothetical protein